MLYITVQNDIAIPLTAAAIGHFLFFVGSTGKRLFRPILEGFGGSKLPPKGERYQRDSKNMSVGKTPTLSWRYMDLRVSSHLGSSYIFKASSKSVQ